MAELGDEWLCREMCSWKKVGDGLNKDLLVGRWGGWLSWEKGGYVGRCVAG